MNLAKLIPFLAASIWVNLSDACAVRCTKINDYLCATENLITPSFINRVETLTHLLFSICHYDPEDKKTYKVVHDDANLKNSNYRPSLAITLAECSDIGTMVEVVDSNFQVWHNPDCYIDNFLILVVRNDTVFPQLIVRRQPLHDLQLERNFNLSSLEEITEIALLKMEELNRAHQVHTEDFIEHSQDIKSHWPTWALIVVVVCIVLSLLAFFLGNYITKRATPIRNKGQPAIAGKRDRKWGAGFSGGLWAAA